MSTRMVNRSMILLLLPFSFVCCGEQGTDGNDAVCGNGIREGFEQCDDGNRVSGDGCDAMCRIENVWIQPDGAAGKDANVFSLEADMNLGDRNYAYSLAWTFQGRDGVRRSYFEFAMPEDRLHCSVRSANLHLFNHPDYEHAGLDGKVNDYEILRVVEAWDENSITWNQQPAVDEGSAIHLLPPGSSREDVKIDVTSLVEEWIADPGANHGVLVKLVTEEPYRFVSFTSSDFEEASRRPALEIAFHSCP